MLKSYDSTDSYIPWLIRSHLFAATQKHDQILVNCILALSDSVNPSFTATRSSVLNELDNVLDLIKEEGYNSSKAYVADCERRRVCIALSDTGDKLGLVLPWLLPKSSNVSSINHNTRYDKMSDKKTVNTRDVCLAKSPARRDYELTNPAKNVLTPPKSQDRHGTDVSKPLLSRDLALNGFAFLPERFVPGMRCLFKKSGRGAHSNAMTLHNLDEECYIELGLSDSVEWARAAEWDNVRSLQLDVYTNSISNTIKLHIQLPSLKRD